MHPYLSAVDSLSSSSRGTAFLIGIITFWVLMGIIAVYLLIKGMTKR